MNLLVLTGRILYSLIFIISGFGHLVSGSNAHAEENGVPMAAFLVPASGFLAMVSGLSILIGYKTKLGAFGILLFLIPVTLMMHNFWTIEDPIQHMMQKIMFMKNVTMMGAALLIMHFGAGPMSIDNRNLS